ncbi:MAG: ferrous iron transport protein B [Culicoidibacterales bacterium]
MKQHDKKPQTIALVGNPNVGKTTLFNTLTGFNQRVGNFPGITIERKEGNFAGMTVVDLPGIYSLDTFSPEEQVTKAYLESAEADVIVNIVDASNLERNLYLTLQLTQFGKPVIVLLNMMDLAQAKGYTIDVNELQTRLQMTVIPIRAKETVAKTLLQQCLQEQTFLPFTWEYAWVDANQTYRDIETNFMQGVIHKQAQTKMALTERIDRIVLNKWLAIPSLLAIVFVMFGVTFDWVGGPLSDLLAGLFADGVVPWVETTLLATSPAWFQSFIIDGIFGGIEPVIAALPIVLVLFICLSFLEDSGYMSRVALILDRVMHRLGLSGKAIVPMMLGFGCAVPAVMATKALESPRQQKLATLLLPFMSCNARLPVYALFATIFFPKNEGLIIASLYILGIIVAIILGLIFNRTIFKGDDEPFILEVPEYRIPTLNNIFKQTWEKGKGFVKRATTFIVAANVVVWTLSHVGLTPTFGYVENLDQSILALIGSWFAPIFAPLGFGNWQSVVAIVSGFMAKESVVSTLGVLFAGGEGNLANVLPTYFTTASAYSFLVFTLLYTPCMAVIATVKKEFGTKMMWIIAIYPVIIAWLVAWLVYAITNMLL